MQHFNAGSYYSVPEFCEEVISQDSVRDLAKKHWKNRSDGGSPALTEVCTENFAMASRA